jgi:hypothetical protein
MPAISVTLINPLSAICVTGKPLCAAGIIITRSFAVPRLTEYAVPELISWKLKPDEGIRGIN